MNIGIVGPAGSGKGTHADNIAERYGIVHLVVGDALRDEIRSGSGLGQEIKSFTSEGKAVPSEHVVRLVKKQMDNSKDAKGFLLDSAPYNMDQVHAFEKIMNIDGLLLLDFDDYDVIRNRLGKRRTCPGCHLTTNTDSAPNEVCPNCGAKLEVRADDKLEVINKRLLNFDENVRPAVEYYKKQNKLISVNANGTVDEVWERIKQELDKFLNKGSK